MLEPIIQRMASVSGAGVKVSGIARCRDLFVDAVLRAEIGNETSFKVQKDVMDQIQAIVAEPSDDSIRAAIDGFSSAWHDVSIAPESMSARAQVMERGRTLADTFKHLGGQLDSLGKDVETAIQTTVGRVNLLAAGVRDFNLEISRAVARGEPTSDLMDQRDLLLDELASLSGATVTYLDNGASVRVSIGGFPLLDQGTLYSLEARFQSDGTEFRWVSGPGEYSVIPSVGGSLGGYKVARDEMTLGFKKELEGLLKYIAGNVNHVHSQGESLVPGLGGLHFFEFDEESSLITIKVNPDIVEDTNLICASGVPDDPRDGSIALRIADVLGGQETPLEDASLGAYSGAFNDVWAGMVGKLGAVGQKVQSGYDIQQILVKELSNRKDSISGVSVDEEVAILIRQQHAFNAASRLITIADEALDTIVNRMGLAGR